MQTVWLLTSFMVYIGNSLKYPSYKTAIGKICRGLDRWTGIPFYSSFKNVGEVLPIRTQNDGISCGVCVLNALEHEMFNTWLFTHDIRDVLRVQYFTDVMTLLIDHVSRMYNISQRSGTDAGHDSQHRGSAKRSKILSNSILFRVHGILMKRYLRRP